ncbi:MAG: LamG domain-containing protein [Williamsia sp.]|nr:LamG domain-containing protein [Williamsia sp.]
MQPSNLKYRIAGMLILAISFAACTKTDNPNNLPAVSPNDYVGKVDGYTSSDEVYPGNIIAQWTFDENKNEKLTGTAPTSTLNDALVDGGIRGKALSLNAGYLYYAVQFPKFKADSLKNFTVSMWTKIANNGSKRTMLFELARPGIFYGSLNIIANTNQATTITTLKLQPLFTTAGGGTQDNLNATINPTIGLDKWTHIVVTYNSTTGIFNEWADGVNIGSYSSRGTAAGNLFKSWEPGELIIGSNYNGIPGKTVSTDVSFAPMTGQIDEIRVYNIALPDANIRALYNLGKVNK